MNVKNCHLNSRYSRELDFAKFYHYGLTGIHDKITEIKKQGGSAFQSASLILYHQPIKLFKPYKIVTRIIWWDSTAIYLQQKFVSFDGIVHVVVLSKQRITKVNVVNLMQELKGGVERLEEPEELRSWVEAMKLSSEKLRK